MLNKDDEDWEDEDWEDEDPKEQQSREIQKLFSELHRKAENYMRYLLLEGFVEPGETPGTYKYTPEGLVLAQQEYKKMLE
jgi:predicted transcriptional regulator